ncbi:UNVERIFIED_CONTAM: putative mitochondrial protein [Sesamum radiatum]|uniref:Mitochondrial protein n=1 Tax=Sesamum radiatum TaxID=300843 RepID=A0AAW2QH91_SESRA
MFLSQLGRKVLIKAVIQAVPAYVMTVFRIPDTLLREIKRMMADFFWNHGEPRKIYWVAWRKVCRSKDEGGLGFRDLKRLSTALCSQEVMEDHFEAG